MGYSLQLVGTFILQSLLPRGCCRAIYSSKKYEDSWRCNFIGLQPSTPLPQHATLYVALDILAPEAVEAVETVTNCDELLESLTISERDPFEGYTFILSTPVLLPDKGSFQTSHYFSKIFKYFTSCKIEDDCKIHCHIF